MGYCIKCGRTLDDKEFYTSKNKEKYPPNGKLNQCKRCLTMHVDNWDPETYKWILEEIDVPYIEDAWNELLARYGTDAKKVTGVTILGRYLSKMKLNQYKDTRWKDTEAIAEKAKQRKILEMQAQGLSSEEIENQLSTNRTPAKPRELMNQQQAVGTPQFTDNFDSPDEFEDQLTEEDKLMLRLKWGKGYRAEEWVRMEQLYDDMMKSYDIQGAGHKDTLIMICKASLKTNQLMDAGDIDGAQKMARMYDSLMKSAKLTAAQNRADSNDFVDSVGQLVAMCEADEFIPKFYIDSPNDKVDRVIQDMQDYTSTLVRDELGLGSLIENSLRNLEKEKAAIQAAAENGEDFEAKQEEELFRNEEQLTDSDISSFLYDEGDDGE